MDFDFEETIENNKSKVIFKSKNEDANIKRIEYSLILDKYKKWKIIDINYAKGKVDNQGMNQ